MTHENDKKFGFNEVVLARSHAHSPTCRLRLHSSSLSTQSSSLEGLLSGPLQKKFADPSLQAHFPSHF